MNDGTLLAFSSLVTPRVQPGLGRRVLPTSVNLQEAPPSHTQCISQGSLESQNLWVVSI